MITQRWTDDSRAPVAYVADPTISIVLIHDSRVVREGVALLINSHRQFRLFSAGAGTDEAGETIRDMRPDVVLLDLGVGEQTVMSLIAMVRSVSIRSKIVLMGLLTIEQNVDAYVTAGVSGFLMKDASFDDFFLTIRSICAPTDGAPKPLASLEAAPSSASRGEGTRIPEGVHLTTRECDVIELLSRGHSNREIAMHLNIALHTVKSHVHNVLEKLDLRSRLQVAAFSHAVGGVNNVRQALQRQ